MTDQADTGVPMKRTSMFVLAIAAVAIQLGCAAEESAPLGVDDVGENSISLLRQIEGRYAGNWTIEIFPNLGVVGVCPGHMIIRAKTIRERLEGGIFTGTYFIDAAGDCATGSTVTGELINGTLREDGGVNFGLDVPRSDGNFFEDVLAGSGVNFTSIEALGCALRNADLNNHMDGSILSGQLRAANSAGLLCSQPPRTDSLPDFAMRVSINATR